MEKGKSKQKTGRKRITFTDEDYLNITKWAGLGLSETQIADNLGVGISTITRNKKRNERFEQALKKGRSKAIEQVTNALFNNAVHDNNTTAQIFYLKNRDATNWSDRQEVNHNLDLKSILTNAKDRLIIDAQATPTNEQEFKQIATDTNE
jgi:IS30 family transposase|tara:strand:- start:773 stop:1222 length:450 start_codon:yes stop_codon:yes gene_type:complete